MADAQAIEKPAGEHYDTTDQMMCEVLLMKGHQAAQVKQGSDGHLIYSFPVAEVWPTVEGILTGGASVMTFTYEAFWKARMTWVMNLRHYAKRGK